MSRTPMLGEAPWEVAMGDTEARTRRVGRDNIEFRQISKGRLGGASANTTWKGVRSMGEQQLALAEPPREGRHVRGNAYRKCFRGESEGSS